MKTVEGKLVVLGSQGVGKTSIVARYMGQTFSKHVSPTIGASFFTCQVKVNDMRVKLQVWDTAGQERFRAMAPMYYRNANAALLVFDITQRHSFKAIQSWVHELKRNVDGPIVLVVVGNKTDLEGQRAVTREDAFYYTSMIGATYYETSALHDQGIEKVFFNTSVALIRISSELGNLKTYDSDESLTHADCTTLQATDAGKTELGSWSIDHIAHGSAEKSFMCC